MTAYLNSSAPPFHLTISVWREQCPPAINTTNSIADLVRRGEIDMVYHSGDISYANGYLSGWDFFLDMVSPISGAFQAHCF